MAKAVSRSDPVFQLIKADRPHLKDTTIKAYVRTVRTFYRKLGNTPPDGVSREEDILNTGWYTRYNDYMSNLQGLSLNTQRNYLSTMIVFLNAKEIPTKEYKIIMDQRDSISDAVRSVKADKGGLTEMQKEEWSSPEEIKAAYDEMASEIKFHGVMRKEVLGKNLYNLLLEYVVISFTTWGLLYPDSVFPPLRNELATLKYIDCKELKKLKDDERTSNYLVKSGARLKYELNDYKTFKSHGRLELIIPKDLAKIIKVYLRHTDHDKLFLQYYDTTELTRLNLTQFLQGWFRKSLGKQISTTLIRKLYLSQKYGDVKDNMEEDAKIMGHTVDVQQSTYTVKKSDQPQERAPLELESESESE